MLGVVPGVEFVLVLRVDVGVDQKNAVPFLRHSRFSSR
jgi:hypothetical protein